MLQEALGDLLGRAVVACRRRDLGSQLRKEPPDHHRIQRLVAVGAEHLREVRGLNPPEHDVGVGDRQRAITSVARRPGVGSSRVRAHAVPAAVEVQYRAAPGGDGIDRQHGRS